MLKTHHNRYEKFSHTLAYHSHILRITRAGLSEVLKQELDSPPEGVGLVANYNRRFI